MHVCIATPEFIGPVRNGGVGTACLGLAEALRDAGHRVSVLYASNFYKEGDFNYWRQHYSAMEIDFHTLEPTDKHKYTLPNSGYAMSSASISRCIYDKIKNAEYDVVHFPDYVGLGFYTSQAAALNQFDPSTAVITALHGPSIWARTANGDPVSFESLVRDAMERVSVERSDAVISPSRYLLAWVKERGWSLPASHQALYSIPARAPVTENTSIQVDDNELELVFFGRIEERKGLSLFIDAVAQLSSSELNRKIRVTFLGKIHESTIYRESIGLRMHSIPVRWRVLDELDSEQAISYLLSGNDKLAILPSIDDNSPCAVYECLLNRIPFITTAVGGIPEIVDEGVQSGVLIQPSSFALADAVKQAMQKGLQASAPAPRHSENASRLVALHEEILAVKRSGLDSAANTTTRFGRGGLRASAVPASDASPLISVCLVHRNRPEFLEQALKGYEDQEFRNFEVIIADNGSADEIALTTLRAWAERNPFSFPLRILELGFNRFEVGGRNAAAGIARGALLKFHDDDNVPKPHELRVFAEAMATGRADAISCGLDMFSGSEMPTGESQISTRIIFLGDGGAASYLQNVMGDSNFIIDRAVFESVGGFEERGFNAFAEDWNFLAKLKSAGFVVGTIPEALIWYRAPPDNWVLDWRRLDTAGARGRIRRTLAGHLSPEVQQLIAMAQSRGEPRSR